MPQPSAGVHDEDDDSSTTPFKLAVAVRKDLGMSSGKLAAQVGHAVHQAMTEGKRAKLKAWDDDGGMIVVLQVAGQAELKQLKTSAKRAGLAWTVVEDEGLTEVESGASTTIAIGPDESEKVNVVTGHLRLYQSQAEEDVATLRGRIEELERQLAVRSSSSVAPPMSTSDTIDMVLTLAAADTDPPVVPEMHEQWTWEGDESVLPHKWHSTLEDAFQDSAMPVPQVKPWMLPDFDREGIFFITHRSDTCGVAAVCSGRLLAFGVVQDYRRKGIGRSLLGLCIHRQLQLGTRTLTCTLSSAASSPAHILLSQMGFKPMLSQQGAS
mmetsp:Transcript_30072/g.70093  ORF Transcript_30072/g.70093 Transcript_30072/m.70093 type:complete len:324 (+) Transcript_30072:138-1109(+)